MHSDESWKTTSAVVRIAAGTGTILIEAYQKLLVCVKDMILIIAKSKNLRINYDLLQGVYCFVVV